VFCCTRCRDELNLTKAFDGTYTNRAGPTPLPTTPDTTPTPTSKTQPSFTIVAPADSALTPTLERTPDGLKQVYNFGDVSLVLSSMSFSSRSYFMTNEDAQTRQHHALWPIGTDFQKMQAYMDTLEQKF
jgi:hypothetical protein